MRRVPYCPVCHRNDKVVPHPIKHHARNGWWACLRPRREVGFQILGSYEWHRKPAR